MEIVGFYSFKDGQTAIETNYPLQLREVKLALGNINAEQHKVKTSKEKTMPGKMLYSPRALNKAFKTQFERMEWEINPRIKAEYTAQYYLEDYTPSRDSQGAFREMDYVKDKLGVEIQFGKYAFMVYNVCAKMTIFHKHGLIDAGIEIVPVKEFANEMSSGVSYFEQFVWDLENRGVSDIDIPVLILGIK